MASVVITAKGLERRESDTELVCLVLSTWRKGLCSDYEIASDLQRLYT